MEDLESLREKAKEYCLIGDYKQALEYYNIGLNCLDEIKTLPGTRGLFLLNRAICHNKLKDWHSAIKDCDLAFNIYGNANKERISKVLYTRAVAFSNINEKTKAQIDLEMSLKYYPSKMAEDLLKTLLLQVQDDQSNEKLISLLKKDQNDPNHEEMLCEEFQKFIDRIKSQKTLIFDSSSKAIMTEMPHVTNMEKLKESYYLFLQWLLRSKPDKDGPDDFFKDLGAFLGPIINVGKMCEDLIKNVTPTNSNNDQVSVAIIQVVQYFGHIEQECMQEAIFTSLMSISDAIRENSLLCLGKLLNKTIMQSNSTPLSYKPPIVEIIDYLGQSTAKEDAETMEMYCLSKFFQLLDDHPSDGQAGQSEKVLDALIGRAPPKVKKMSLHNMLKMLNILKALYIGNRAAFRRYLSQNEIMPAIFEILLHVRSHEVVQTKAAEIIGKCVEFVELRPFFEMHEMRRLVDLMNLFEKIVQTHNAPLKIQVASILVRICTHNAEILHSIFTTNFLSRIWILLANIERNVKDDTLEPALQIFGFLAIHKIWKERLLEIKPRQVFSSMLKLGEIALSRNNSLTYSFLRAIYYLISTRDDELSSSFKNNKKDFNLDYDQLFELEEIRRSLPPQARQRGDFIYDLGDLRVCDPIRTLLVQENFVHTLSTYVQSAHTPSENIYSTILSIIRLLGLKSDLRGLIAQQGGLTILLRFTHQLKSEEESKEARQAIAHICMSINTSSLSYREINDVIPHMIELIQDSYQLYQYEASLALIQITHIDGDTRERIWKLDGWKLFRDLIFSDHNLIKTSGLEGWCNLTNCELAVNFFIEKSKNFEEFLDIKILFSYLLEDRFIKSQRAAAGAIATFMSYKELLFPFYKYSKFSNVIKSWEVSDDQQLLDRLFIILNFILMIPEVSEDEKGALRILIRKKMSKVSKGSLQHSDPSLNSL